MDTLLGFQRLAQLYNVAPVQSLHTRSRLGSIRQRELRDGEEVSTWPAKYRPQDNFRGHFEFGLKYERLNFEFFSRLMHQVDPQEIAQWIQAEPTGSYARRAAFFYEWFTGKQLPVSDTAANVAAVQAIDSDEYLTAAKPTRNRRWRMVDNMPGPRQFCPLVYLGPKEQRQWHYDVTAGVRHLDDTYGPHLLRRCAAWLTFKESRASFAIEHEADKQDRVRRFAAAIGEFSGRLENPMSEESLLLLQRAVLGDKALRVGVRASPVFVGQNSFGAQIVHYIAPEPQLLPDMIEGIRQFEQRTRGLDSVVRAAAVSFAFVYLHPLADGNGRIHRFLINHLLAADGAVPTNIIVPVSATIAGSARAHAEYDRVLESFSRPFMHRYADAYRFGNRRVCPDGVETDFEFLATEDARHAWSFPDLSEHVRYMSSVLKDTVEHEMAGEAYLLRQYDRARGGIKDIVEMPDQDADMVIRSLKENGWQVSNKLRKALPILFHEEGRLYAVREQVIAAARDAFVDDVPGAEEEDALPAPAPRA